MFFTAKRRQPLQTYMAKIGLSLVAVTLVVAPVHAEPAVTGVGHITWMGSGWSVSQMRVTLDAPQINPGNCAQPVGYITDPADPGAVLFHSMLLTAYASSKQITLAVNGCIGGYPRLIAISIH